MQKIISILFILLLPPRFSFAAQAIDLRQCYKLALKHSTEITISDEKIHEARARFLRALGGVLPKLSVTGTETLQDTSTNSIFSGNDISQPQVAVTLTVPLFQGLKEVSVLKSSRSDRELYRLGRKEAERLLFADVAQAFYLTLKIEQDIARTAQMIGVFRERAGEIRRRVELGKSRAVEESSQRTELAMLTAELESLRGERTAAYEMMIFLTGLSPHPKLAEKGWNLKTPDNVEAYVTMTTERTDVVIKEKEVELAVGKKGVARSELLPHLNFQGDYYPYRSGYLKNIDWDAAFTLSVPVFDLQSVGSLREADARVKQAKLRLEGRRRVSETEVRKNFASHVASRRTLFAYENAVRQAGDNYRLQSEDERIGLSTNLDVLTAQKLWLDAMRLRDQSKIRERLDWIKLQVAAGVLP